MTRSTRSILEIRFEVHVQQGGCQILGGEAADGCFSTVLGSEGAYEGYLFVVNGQQPLFVN